MNKISRPLLITLIITVLLSIWALVQPGQNTSALAAKVAEETHEKPHQTAKPPRHGSSSQNRDRRLLPMTENPFGVTVSPEAPEVFLDPPPPVTEQETVVPVTPEPPPLPFKYIGSITEHGLKTYFISDSNRVYPTEAGNKITPDYELSQASETELVLTYLPLARTQILRIEN